MKAVCIVPVGIYHHLRSMMLRLELNNCQMKCFTSVVMDSGADCAPHIAR